MSNRSRIWSCARKLWRSCWRKNPWSVVRGPWPTAGSRWSDIQRATDNGQRTCPRISGVRVRGGVEYRAAAVILTTGTFLQAIMHTGETKTAGGRAGEGTTSGISGALNRLGFELARFKTGTPCRLNGRTIDYSAVRNPTRRRRSAAVQFPHRTIAARSNAVLDHVHQRSSS